MIGSGGVVKKGEYIIPPRMAAQYYQQMLDMLNEGGPDAESPAEATDDVEELQDEE
jgi:hypothetical protein